jgi:hypothetical protein
MKILTVVFVSSLMVGCGSVHRVEETGMYRSGNCSVVLYQTKDEAIRQGMKREICVVDGSSSMSFDHSVEGAIKKNIPKVCGCGARKAYIQSRSNDPFGLSYVTLVGFE